MVALESKCYVNVLQPMKKPITSLVRPKDIERLALPSNLRYGQAIFKRSGVEIIKSGSYEVEAWVGGLDGSVSEGGSQRRRTKLSSTSKGLSWHCTGNPKNHQIFCKHCVALALTISDKSS